MEQFRKYVAIVTPLEYVNFDSKVIDDVSFYACYENNLKIDLFTKHNDYDIMEMIAEELHPKKPVSHVYSDSDVEINHPLYDIAHVVEKFKHEDEVDTPYWSKSIRRIGVSWSGDHDYNIPEYSLSLSLNTAYGNFWIRRIGL
ncbi:hypothetical protein Tco_1169370 [Tanacetum coccineum]